MAIKTFQQFQLPADPAAALQAATKQYADAIAALAVGGCLTGNLPNPGLAAVSTTPRSGGTVSTAQNVDGTVAGDAQYTCTGNVTFTPTGTPNGRMMIIEGLASGAARTLAVAAGVLLPSSGGPASRSLTVPSGSVGVFGLRYSSLRGGWILMSALIA